MQIPNGSNEIDQKLVILKRKLEALMIEFNKLLIDKTLSQNKTNSQVTMETDYMQRLISTAHELDQLNPYEGTYALLVLALRQGLYFKDAIHAIEHDVHEITKENAKLRRQNQEQKNLLNNK